jgi:galactose mutarotase-like enzyme
MIHTIKNEHFQLFVKQTGAEICSIKSIKRDKEFIWDGNPAIWPNHAPILFPIVGSLKGGKYKYKAKEYALPQHGFMRNNHDVNLVESTDSSLTFFLKNNEEILKNYPFEFQFYTKYRLDKNTISVEHEVYNPSNEQLLFSIGAHPAFKCPINENEKYEDYYLEFEKEEDSLIHCIDNGLIGKETKKIFNSNNKIDLHPQIFDQGALVFKDLKSTSISLKSKKSKEFLKMSYEGFPYMGIWAKPNAPFVCIEPWLGIADGVNSDQNLETKEGIIKLEADSWFKAKYYIEIFE